MIPLTSKGFCQNVVLVLVVTATTVLGYPLGAPEPACVDIFPIGHNTTVENMATGPVPFTVDISSLNNGYTPGQSYRIVLSGTNASEDFRGFLIQGRTMADGSPVGTFEIGSNTNQQTVCNGMTAATHTNNTDKSMVELTWRAPSSGTGTVVFRYAFVDMYRPTENPAVNVFWANLNTATVAEIGGGGGGDSGGATGMITAASMVTLLVTSIIALIV